MNYALHYQRLISRARTRVLAGYVERHHVVPRCVGGTDESANIVHLTPEEHYVAHQLLVKLHPGVGRLIYAAMWMAKRCSGNKAYGWLRRRFVRDLSVKQKGTKRGPRSIATKTKISLGRQGFRHSSASRAKMSASRAGKKRVPRSPERQVELSTKLSALRKGKPKRPQSLEHRAKIAAARLGKKHTPEARLRMSVSHKRQRQDARARRC